MISRTILKRLSQNPGVYTFRNRQGTPIYVGKAKHLRERLTYYFQSNLLSGRTRLMVRDAAYLETTETVSEVDALILEADLIKKFKPRYNVALKDDKNYLLIKVENSRRQPFPKVLTVRQRENDGAEYFGPYPLGSSIKKVMRQLRKIYNFRDCSNSKFNKYRRLGRGCLYYDLKLCLASCIGRITPAEYGRVRRGLRRFLSEGSPKIEAELNSLMQCYSRNLAFEKAEEVKKKIEVIKKIREIKFSPEDYRQNPFLAQDRYRVEMRQLADFINLHTGGKLNVAGGQIRLEAYDISNLYGRQPTASLVVFENGRPQKNGYKRFKIKNVKGINDYLMIAEVMARRLKHHDWPQPDLILIDGGAGQVRAAQKVLTDSFKAPIIGLAKRLERIYINGRYVKPSRASPLMDLLIRLRDESHRFAKKYHKLLRLKYALDN